MRNFLRSLLAVSTIALSAVSAQATSLSISPVSIEVAAPGATSRVTLENNGTELVSAQVRVFKWVQKNGKDELMPTRDVVASPPVIKIQPGKKNVVRIVRVGKAPVAGEETYRLLVSEIPTPAQAANKAVTFAIQYSVPVFFVSKRGNEALTWTARMSKGNLVVEAVNGGSRRSKLVNMKIGVPDGKSITVAEGLAGYVLPDSSKVWVARPKTLKSGSKITITAQTEQGPVNATALVAGQ